MSILDTINIKPSVSDTRPIVSLTANKTKYTARNDSKKKIHQYHKLDEHPHFHNHKCVDYALYVEEDNLLYLIELKGSDIEHAYSQVLATFKKLQVDIDLKKREAKGRIVVSKVRRPAVYSNECKRLKKECELNKLDVLCESQQMTESI